LLLDPEDVLILAPSNYKNVVFVGASQNQNMKLYCLVIFGLLFLYYPPCFVALRHKAAFVATWKFGKLAADKSIPMLQNGASSVDAVEIGINNVERDTVDQYFVGVGGYPTSKGIMELDAAIMDDQLRCGAVMSLPNIATPISVARSIMEECPHNVLTAEGALEWAVAHGFKEENILTPDIAKEYAAWKASEHNIGDNISIKVDKETSHDTVGVICLDHEGKLCCGTSTSG